jgi:hypothetical protein
MSSNTTTHASPVADDERGRGVGDGHLAPVRAHEYVLLDAHHLAMCVAVLDRALVAGRRPVRRLVHVAPEQLLDQPSIASAAWFM